MSNSYYNRSAAFAPRTKARSENVRDEFDAVSAGLDKLPESGAIAAGSVTYAADTGVANAYVIALAKPPTTYSPGMTVLFKAGNANTDSSTINVNSLGVKSLLRQDGSALRAGDINAGEIVQASYNGSHFRLISSTSKMVSDAEAAVSAAADEVQHASEWSQSDEDVPVSTEAGGDGATTYSALHWSSKAQGFASASQDFAGSADNSANSAATSANSASTSASAANESKSKAQEWSEKATDTEVEPGSYSAKHWAEKAAQSVADGVIDDSTTSAESTWSSEKIGSEIDSAIAGIPQTADFQEFTASGTWTKPANCSFVYVEVLGGGGGGGAEIDQGVSYPGQGGNFVSKLLSASGIGSTETIVVGSGGLGGRAYYSAVRFKAGETGGSSSFGSHVSAEGGTGGPASTDDPLVITYKNELILPGDPTIGVGGNTFTQSIHSGGRGGSSNGIGTSQFAGNGGTWLTAESGMAGSGEYPAGGGGAATAAFWGAGRDITGGDGADGRVRVWAW